MALPEVETKWYAFSLDFTRAPAQVRGKVSKQRRCWFKRIATLHPEIGGKLDQLRAPLDVCRRVAFAGGATEQRTRAVELLAELVEKRKPRPRVA